MKEITQGMKSILIVDDNPKNLQVLGNYLQKECYDIEFALDGKSALSWLNRKNFDLILLDIMMPVMDGYEVCRIIKQDKEKKDLPVIFLTAKVDTESLVNAFDVGAVDYLTKPFNQKELIARVSTQIAIKSSRDEVKKSLKEVEDKNKLIGYSIKYAKSIQSAVLNSSQNLSDFFPEHFSLTLPKDIVSGDFYWSAKVNGKYLVGVFDCTGHGVPGAFMSLLFVTFLNEIVKCGSITAPDKILQRLREKVIETLEQKGTTYEVHDGTDAAIICYDPENSVINFSGAFSKIYLIRNNRLLEYKGDRMPVSFFDVMNDFRSQEIKIIKDDLVCLFTDGYRDQFGGPAGKKFGSERFKEVLLDNCLKPVETQKQVLYEVLNSWMQGKFDQTDDITVLGIRF
jgi:phosphoserine phosphatase RsbU/P